MATVDDAPYSPARPDAAATVSPPETRTINLASAIDFAGFRLACRALWAEQIEPGDEINYDYGTDYFKEYIKPIGCKCVACEKKRKKQRAEARAEKARLKAKAERKALKQAEKQAAKADKKKPSKSAPANGKLLNGHGAKSAAGRMAKSGISVKARGKPRGESRASA